MAGDLGGDGAKVNNDMLSSLARGYKSLMRPSDSEIRIRGSDRLDDEDPVEIKMCELSGFFYDMRKSLPARPYSASEHGRSDDGFLKSVSSAFSDMLKCSLEQRGLSRENYEGLRDHSVEDIAKRAVSIHVRSGFNAPFYAGVNYLGDMDEKKFNDLVLKVEQRGHDLIDKYVASLKETGE